MAPTKKDAVHRYFVYNKESNMTTCELCKNKIKGKHTTNLKNHIATKHSNEYRVIEDLNNKIRPNKSSSSDKIAKARIDQIKKLCVGLVTIHGRPLAMMEDEAFQEIINMADTSEVASKAINVKSIKTKIQEEANAIRGKILNEVKNKMISLKLDAATCLERKFVGVNVQYIINGRIVVRNLGVLEVRERQTSTFLKNTIEELLTEFRIGVDQIYCICTDNGSNMIKMVKLMGGEYISEYDECTTEQEEFELMDEHEESDEETTEEVQVNDIFNSIDVDVDNFITNEGTFKVRGMLCAAHTLQLAVKDAINADITIQSTIAMAKNVVNILRKPNNMNRLRNLNLRKPIKDCATRWTSTYNMLVRLVSLRTFCEDTPEVSMLISSIFWSEVEDSIKCFQPVNEATLRLQKEQLTMGDFYITWLNCKNKIAVIDLSFAVALHTSMTQREIALMKNDVILEALYLDSRLNVMLSQEQCQKARALLKQVSMQINSLKERDSLLSNSGSVDTELDMDNPIPSTSSIGYPAIEAMLQSKERVRGNIVKNCSIDVCLHNLCLNSRISLDDDILMHYWLNKASTSAEVTEIANTVLGAPATQVSVERLFSSLKFVLHPLRSNISSNFLKDLMLVRENKDLL